MKFKLVDNWRTGWRWFSTWAFALIAFLASVPLPPEVIGLLPAPIQEHIVAIVAVCGLIFRFIKQGNSHG